MTNKEILSRYLKVIFEAIEEAGENGIPSGHLYAILMEFMSLQTYQAIIDGLTKMGLITHKGYLIKAVK